MACVTLKKTSDWWYGRYKVDGREYTKNLRVKVRGTRPENLIEEGSKQFEVSRAEAQATLNILLRDIEMGKTEEQLAHAVYQARTGGRSIPSYTLNDLASLWKDMPRKKATSERYKQQSLSTITSFVTYMKDHYPAVHKIDHVSPQHAKAFMDSENKRGISPKTWNDELKLMKTTFRRAGSTAFSDLISKDAGTTFREPYLPEELRDILEASHQDEFIRPIIITAVCTAMRLGDCCQLKWESVDLDEGFITVKTSKTGVTVDIPLFPILYDELMDRKANGSPYVFPEQARQYRSNASVLTSRLRKVLAVAGFRDEDDVLEVLAKDDVDDEQVLAAADVYLKSVGDPKRKKNMQEFLPVYLSGASVGAASKAVGVSKGSGSNYLNELETAIKIPFIRGKRRKVAEEAIAPKRGNVHADRDVGLRRASIRDFHSFRTTWITLALTSGMPFELVSKVTGHTTANVVMKHYFRPQREMLKKSIQTHMPKLLTDGMGSVQDNIVELLEGATDDNWRDQVEAALQLIRKGSVS